MDEAGRRVLRDNRSRRGEAGHGFQYYVYELVSACSLSQSNVLVHSRTL